MSIQSDHKALIFVAVVAVLGMGVRVVRAASRPGAPAEQPALEHQAQAADSSAQAGRGGRTGRGGQAGRGGRGAGSRSGGRGRGRSAQRATDDTTGQATKRDSSRRRASGALDRPGYVGGKLDVDIATASQLDSLPGVSTLMARRIASDRMRRGPFLSRDGLRRVVGAGPAFVEAIGPLITFSGTIVQGSPADSIVARRSGKRSPMARP